MKSKKTIPRLEPARRIMLSMTKDDIVLDQKIPMYIHDKNIFLKVIKKMSLDQKKEYFEQMRKEKNFQINITQEEWRVKNPNTKDDIVLNQTIPMYIHDKNIFLKVIEKMSLEQKKEYLEQMRKEKNFQINITQEEWRVKNPNSYRYIQAEKIIDVLNQNGKLLISIINELSTHSKADGI